MSKARAAPGRPGPPVLADACQPCPGASQVFTRDSAAASRGRDREGFGTRLQAVGVGGGASLFLHHKPTTRSGPAGSRGKEEGGPILPKRWHEVTGSEVEPGPRLGGQGLHLSPWGGPLSSTRAGRRAP